jgi:GH35 family endo-1,4-beta-xylanase
MIVGVFSELATYFQRAWKARRHLFFLHNTYLFTAIYFYEVEAAVRQMIVAGAQPDGIGFQSHHAEQNLPSMDEEYATWDRFGALAKQLTVTEYDLTTTDDQLHADHLRDMLTLCFSHPQMTGFVIWGFWETRHLVCSLILE